MKKIIAYQYYTLDNKPVNIRPEHPIECADDEVEAQRKILKKEHATDKIYLTVTNYKE